MNRLIFVACGIAAIAPGFGQIRGGACYGVGCQLDEGFGNRVISGKPLSATEERHSLQVLGDGTRIENTETNRLFRDNEGRTRVERMDGTATIYDPVARFTLELDPATKTARKSPSAIFRPATSTVTSYKYDVVTNAWASAVVTGAQNPQANAAAMKGVMAETTENLGPQAVNGVTAQGMRTTMTIPKGQIGNNRDIKVLTERWTSTDLQMLVKSINSDPRFGETTYQLTKVTQSAPDAALFLIPAGYTVTNGPIPAALRLPAAASGVPRVGARSGAPGPAPALTPAPRVVVP